MTDLFTTTARLKKDKVPNSYTAEDIEVLEGLEPVRRRPGMYIGGTDETALHHLIAEVLDNSMDEAVAGHASYIKVHLAADSAITIEDNGRGIPVDPHPKFPDKSALEVILTTLHSGGKFSNKAYATAGGLHGVGISVVNALSRQLDVEVVRDKILYKQQYGRGQPLGPISNQPTANNIKKSGTLIRFYPDETIFTEGARFKPKKVYELIKAKAYLYRGVEIRWSCDPVLLSGNDAVPATEIIHFPNGLGDYLASQLQDADLVITESFQGEISRELDSSKVEWAMAWRHNEGFLRSYCNTIPTPLGGTHEQGLRAALLKSVRNYGEMVGNKKAATITIDDVLQGACIILSIFIEDPLFQGQTKEKLASNEVVKIVETIIKDRFDHWLSGNKPMADQLLEYFLQRAEERLNRKSDKAVNRKNAMQKLRLPGKLADCTSNSQIGTELFIVEGDSAGGSAKQARNRELQAILPLRGKILNVASANRDKISQNQEIQDLETALACGTGTNYRKEALRYEKIIIMTDADVDGAHIASLLMTFFHLRMPNLIKDGHLYIAKPPLYRITQATKTYYASDEKQKEKLTSELMRNSKAKIEVGRFKGLGEMTALQLKETTMDITKRVLIKVSLADAARANELVEDLMGKKPEKRFNFIQTQALGVMSNIINNLDV